MYYVSLVLILRAARCYALPLALGGTCIFSLNRNLYGPNIFCTEDAVKAEKGMLSI